MTAIYDFPSEWYPFIASQSFKLQSLNQVANRPWSGAGQAVSSRPHTQLFTNTIAFAPLADHMAPELGPVLQDVDAFFTRLRGRSGLVRMPHITRLRTWHDRNLIATKSRFSDGSTFSDGTEFVDGELPPEVQVYSGALKGADYIVLSGFPASLENALRRGDYLEIKPNGVRASFPHLYKAMFGGNTDASGRIGIQIEPRLRQGVNAGDTVSLRAASTIFRMTDDSQFDFQDSGAGQANGGGSLIEALDLVP